MWLDSHWKLLVIKPLEIQLHLVTVLKIFRLYKKLRLGACQGHVMICSVGELMSLVNKHRNTDRNIADDNLTSQLDTIQQRVTHFNTHTHTRTHTRTSTHPHTYAHLHTPTHIHKSTHTYTHLRTYLHPIPYSLELPPLTTLVPHDLRFPSSLRGQGSLVRKRSYEARSSIGLQGVPYTMLPFRTADISFNINTSVSQQVFSLSMKK